MLDMCKREKKNVNNKLGQGLINYSLWGTHLLL